VTTVHELAQKLEAIRAVAINKARELYGSDEINVEDLAATGIGADGVWVQGWLLVKNEELDLENLPVENEIMEEE
jgi:hypothetical protein